MTDEKNADELLHSVIENKQQQVDEIIAPRMERLTAREEAYKRIVEMTKTKFGDYFMLHPDRATDDRGKDAETETLGGLREIFDILEDYLISFRDKADIQVERGPDAT